MKPLLLQEAQVHTGMIVALALADKGGEPEMDEKGPLLLKALMGGIPMRKKLYTLNGRPELFSKTPDGWKSQPLTDQPLDINPTAGMEGFDERVRFRPIYTFTPKELPHNMKFVVYVDGKRLKYPSGQNNVYVRTDAKGRILSHNGYEYDLWQQEYALPDNAVLVPIGRIEATEVPHAPAIVYKGPESEWITVLVELAKQAAMFGIRVHDAHRDMPSRRHGPYLHLTLEGGILGEVTQRGFAEKYVGASGDARFMTQCPYCWQTIMREHSL